MARTFVQIKSNILFTHRVFMLQSQYHGHSITQVANTSWVIILLSKETRVALVV
jgi:hypothetical protein